MFNKILVYSFIIIVVFVLSGCRNPVVDPPGENQAPYDIVGPVEQTVSYKFDEEQYFSLVTNSPDLNLDPDGDIVTFFNLGLPEGVSIEPSTGVITIITPSNTTYDEEITVWTEDEHELKSADFILTIKFVPAT